MPVKRSRIVRSSSFGEASVLNHSPDRRLLWRSPQPSTSVKPSGGFAKILRPSVAETEQSRPKILSLASPKKDRVDLSRDGTIGGFLEKCFFCGKKIRENDEVFMYSYLRAFCTAECRDKQIAMDKEVEEVSEELAKTLNENQKTKCEKV
ncbi:Zf-FLZ domain [Dillenia turbinata]|uniref:Zf-FLZ domain n=1 Tax=Dillenia turbinata TaxID=194707 RepID=A0AAN8VAD5_9MAGN